MSDKRFSLVPYHMTNITALTAAMNVLSSSLWLLHSLGTVLSNPIISITRRFHLRKHTGEYF
jgi:hypothetical protein